VPLALTPDPPAPIRPWLPSLSLPTHQPPSAPDDRPSPSNHRPPSRPRQPSLSLSTYQPPFARRPSPAHPRTTNLHSPSDHPPAFALAPLSARTNPPFPSRPKATFRPKPDHPALVCSLRLSPTPPFLTARASPAPRSAAERRQVQARVGQHLWYETNYWTFDKAAPILGRT